MVVLFTSCRTSSKNGTPNVVSDTTSIKLKYYSELIINDKRIIKCVDDYIKLIERNDNGRPYVYQMIIGRYIADTASFILSYEEDKDSFMKHIPLGYFSYKNRKFYVFSAISAFCSTDSSIVVEMKNESGKLSTLDERLKDTTGRYSAIWEPPSIIYKIYHDTISYKGVIAPLSEKKMGEIKSYIPFRPPINGRKEFTPPKKVNYNYNQWYE